MNDKVETVTREITEEEFKTATMDSATDMDKYAENYSESNFLSKIKDTIKKTGLGLIYKALQLYYVTENPNCPKKVKFGIYAALGYFITPLDVIPDFIIGAGYADDASTIAIALVMAQMYIDDTIKQKAKDKIRNIFGNDVVSKLS